MATKPARIIELNWPTLSGRILDGGYEIQELLEADALEATFKIRVLGAHTVNAYVDLVQMDASSGEQQVEAWRSAKELNHPNLNTPLSFGWTQLDNSDLVYVILNRPDERLSGVLCERPLNSSEAGELLKSIVAGLEYLHAHGFVHGCVSPEQVLSIGESVQLSTVCIRRINTVPSLELTRAQYVAPENPANLTPAADVWCLGATLFESITRETWSGGSLDGVTQLPEPFARIARRCLDRDPETRCKLAEVTALYRGPSSARVASQSTAQVLKPPVSAEVPLVSRAAEPRVESGPTPRRTWIYAAIGLIVVLAAIWLARPKRMAVMQHERSSTKATTPAPVSRGSAWETRTLTPPDGSTRKNPAQNSSAAATTVRTETAPSHGIATAAKSEQHTANGSVWRLVLYTYARQQDAEKKAQSLNAKHADLHAEVFSPSGSGGPYLVTAGGRMSREDAARLRQQVRGIGMPRDSYIQNYKQ